VDLFAGGRLLPVMDGHRHTARRIGDSGKLIWPLDLIVPVSERARQQYGNFDPRVKDISSCATEHERALESMSECAYHKQIRVCLARIG
jgi:hypothetical protein